MRDDVGIRQRQPGRRAPSDVTLVSGSCPEAGEPAADRSPNRLW